MGIRAFLSCLKKWEHWWVFLVIAAVCSVHLELKVTPRNLKLGHQSTVSPPMWMGMNCMSCILFPEIYDQLLSCADIKTEVGLQISQEFHLISVGHLLRVGDQAHNGCVNDGLGGVSGHTVMCKKECSSGLRMLPWGLPLLRIRVEEVFLPISTCCGLLVTKSWTHLHRVALSPRPSSIWISLVAMAMLNA